MEIWKSQKQRFPDSHRHDDYGVLDQRTINNNSRKSVTYLPGLNCYLCPGLYNCVQGGLPPLRKWFSIFGRLFMKHLLAKVCPAKRNSSPGCSNMIDISKREPSSRTAC